MSAEAWDAQGGAAVEDLLRFLAPAEGVLVVLAVAMLAAWLLVSKQWAKRSEVAVSELQKANAKLLRELQLANAAKSLLQDEMKQAQEELRQVQEELKQAQAHCEELKQSRVTTEESDETYCSKCSQSSTDTSHVSNASDPKGDTEIPVQACDDDLDESVSLSESDLSGVHITVDQEPSEVQLPENPTASVVDDFVSATDHPFELAVKLLTAGTGSQDKTLQIIPKLLKTLSFQKFLDAEAVAKKALESNEMKDLVSIADDIKTPNVIRAKLRLKVMILNQRLQDAIESESEEDLSQAILEAKLFNEEMIRVSLPNHAQEEVPLDSIQAAEEILSKVASRLSTIIKSDTVEPTTLQNTLSEEFWNWQPLPTEGDGQALEQYQTDTIETIGVGLEMLAGIHCRKELRQAIDTENLESLKEIVHVSRLRGVFNLPELDLAEQAMYVQDCCIQIHNGIHNKDIQHLTSWIQKAEDLCGSIDDEVDEEMNVIKCRSRKRDPLGLIASLTKSLPVEKSRLLDALSHGKRELIELTLTNKLQGALESQSINALREAIHAYRSQMEISDWLKETELLKSTEQKLEQVLAMLYLEQARTLCSSDSDCEIKTQLLQSGAALSRAEEVDISTDGELFMTLEKAHTDILSRYLGNTFGLTEKQVSALFQMGLSRADDLSTLVEGDLRQAEVRRITCKKILPALVAFGEEASRYNKFEVNQTDVKEV